eukprot:47534-Chlamydomonas_euryale.AAC.1
MSTSLPGTAPPGQRSRTPVGSRQTTFSLRYPNGSDGVSPLIPHLNDRRVQKGKEGTRAVKETTKTGRGDGGVGRITSPGDGGVGRITGRPRRMEAEAKG